MSMYRLHFTSAMFTSVEVEADNLDDAIEAAYQKIPSAGICAQCSGWGRPWSIDTSEEWDIDESSYEVDGVEVRAEDGGEPS